MVIGKKFILYDMYISNNLFKGFFFQSFQIMKYINDSFFFFLNCVTVKTFSDLYIRKLPEFFTIPSLILLVEIKGPSKILN